MGAGVITNALLSLRLHIWPCSLLWPHQYYCNGSDNNLFPTVIFVKVTARSLIAGCVYVELEKCLRNSRKISIT